MAASASQNGKRRSPSAGESDRSTPDQAFSPAPSTRSSSKQQVRHRASIACVSCRERRIRCVVREGETECAQCRRTGATCIIKDDDERRRPISKAYMSSLSNRIALLEEMLKERGVVPPPAVHPPKTRQEAQARQQQEEQQAQVMKRSTDCEPKALNASVTQPPTPPGSGDEDVANRESAQPRGYVAPGSQTSLFPLIDPVLLQDMEPRKDTGLRQLLCTRATHTFDQSAGRVRFFGPTANSHVYAKSSSGYFNAPERSDQARRAERLIGALRPSTHDHLIRCFWEYYNSCHQVVDEVAFEAGRTAHDPRFYSPFLHITMLAVGYRFADWDREDVKRMTMGNRESTLHRESKTLLETELEKSGGLPIVQALLLLADLECGVGRDTTGWMYSGMASRLAFDIGLHVSPNRADLSELERLARHRVMAACVMSDRRWALFLGRPTSIKAQDIALDVLPRAPGKALANPSSGAPVASHADIHQQMFELMELAGKVADFQNSTYSATQACVTKVTEDRAYLHFIGLERLFHNWYRRLPDNLAWKPANVKSAHMAFFMLHQQFHVCMILLHRPWAKYGPMSFDGAAAARYPSPDSPCHENDRAHALPAWAGPLPHHDNRASLSRSMCTQHAVRVARIFWHHRQRFDGRRIGLAGIQHAGTAALALMAALAHKSAELDHHTNLRYLQVLSTAIYDMSHSYQPAARMYHLLRIMLVDIRSEMAKSGGFDFSTVVGRYHQGNSMVFDSNPWAAAITPSNFLSADGFQTIPEEESRASKRRRLSSLSSMDLSCPAPSFLANAGCPTPPATSQSPDNSTSMVDNTDLTGLINDSTFGQDSLDLIHLSCIEFINNGGAPPQDWAAASPTPAQAPESAELALDSNLTANSETTPPTTSAAGDNAAAAPAAAVDDDTTVDMTIEQWLAEPSDPLTPSPSSSASGTGSASEGALIEPTAPASLAELIPISVSQHCPSSSGTSTSPNTNTNTDGPDTDTRSDENENGPLAMTMVMDLDLDLPDTRDPSSSSSSSSSSSCAASGHGGADAGHAGTEPWLHAMGAPPPPITPGDVNGRSPLTPVTLDDLVQSVEEAVGSARARRAAAAGVGVAAEVCVGGGGSGSGGAVAAGNSPVVRNRELDFLSL